MKNLQTDSTRLTQMSHGSGCGCKIAPAVLEEILAGTHYESPVHIDVLVGYQQQDDAALLDLHDGRALISTTDFFTPIVDDPYDFGRIAAANALSDVYAMGGTPVLATSLLGWPVEKLPAAQATQVIAGARDLCLEAQVPIAGGHSIDTPEPLFGLSVNGIVSHSHAVRNHTLEDGDLLYLTKPLGVGILATALKRGKLDDTAYASLLAVTTQRNEAGPKLAENGLIHAMTDVTGFGLLGHLLEMLKPGGWHAVLNKAHVAALDGINAYLKQFILPDNTMRNWKGYQHRVTGCEGMDFALLADPQTNGGLLMAVASDQQQKFIEWSAKNASLFGAFQPVHIGQVCGKTSPGSPAITVTS